MTREEKIAALRRQDKIAQLRAMDAAAQQKPEPVKYEPVETLMNFLPSAGRVIADTASAVTHPWQLVKSMAAIQQGLSDKLGRKAALLIHGDAGGTDVMPEHSEVAPDAMVNMVKDRYGSLDAIKRTAMDDPAGMMLDLSFGTGLLPKATKVAKAIDPLNAVGNTVLNTIKVVTPRKTPAHLYSNAARFPKKVKQKDRKSAVEAGLENEIVLNEKGLNKTQQLINNKVGEVNRLIDAATANGTTIPADAVFQHFGELRRNTGGFRPEAGKDMEIIQNMEDAMRADIAATGKTAFTPREMQDFKLKAYEKSNYEKLNPAAEAVRSKVLKAEGRGAKDAIEVAAPGVADYNKDLASLYGLQAQLPNAIERSTRMGSAFTAPLKSPLKATMVGGGGYGSGLLGALGIYAALGLQHLSKKPSAQSRLAISLDKLQKGKSFRGQTPAGRLARIPLTDIQTRQMLAEAERIKDEQENNQ